jgi:hypothetical protein
MKPPNKLDGVSGLSYYTGIRIEREETNPAA